MMSVETLPTEILQSIFKFTYTGKAIAKCREVCRRWKEAVDSISDHVWEKMCRKEFSDSYKEAFNKATLPWRGLYKSLSLWPRIRRAKLKWRELQIERDHTWMNELHFQVLKNEIGVAVYEVGDTLDTIAGATNLIVYFNLETLEECRREKFGFQFCRYLENKHFIVVVCKSNGKLCVVPKANRKRFFIGDVSSQIATPEEIKLIGNEVYFKTIYNVLCVARLEENDGEITVNSVQLLDSFPQHIAAVEYIEKDELLILSTEGNIYSISNQKYEVIDKVDDFKFTPPGISNFDLSRDSPTVYKWIKNGLKDNLSCFRKLKNISAVLLYENVLILGTELGVLKIYYNPYNSDGHINMCRRKPDRSIDLKRICKLDACMPFKTLTQIDIVETEHGHKVVISIDRSLIFILEFDHEFERNSKRSLSSASTGGPRVKKTIR